MCIESMYVKTSHGEIRPQACWQLKCTKWRMKRCSGGKGEKLLKKRRANRTTARKNSQHTRNRKASDKQLYGIRFACRYKARNVSPLMKLKGRDIPSGTMAPDNTTQYLMHIVYQDLLSENEMCSSANINCAIDFSRHEQRHSIYGDSTSAQNVYIGLDSAYESSLEFQERDFEDVFHLYCGAMTHLTWSVCTGRSSSVLQTAVSLSQSSESESSALPLPSWPAVKDPRSSSPEP